MKVKMFVNVSSTINITELENEVNEWLSNNAVKIQHVKQSYTFDTTIGGRYCALISIWYV